MDNTKRRMGGYQDTDWDAWLSWILVGFLITLATLITMFINDPQGNAFIQLMMK